MNFEILKFAEYLLDSKNIFDFNQNFQTPIKAAIIFCSKNDEIRSKLLENGFTTSTLEFHCVSKTFSLSNTQKQSTMYSSCLLNLPPDLPTEALSNLYTKVESHCHPNALVMCYSSNVHLLSEFQAIISPSQSKNAFYLSENTRNHFCFHLNPIASKNSPMINISHSISQAVISPLIHSLEKICVSGISLGLPNNKDFKRPFISSQNFFSLFDGENFVENLSEMEVNSLLDLDILQMKKSDGKRIETAIRSPDQMFHLVSRLGKLDLKEEYGVPPFMLQGLDRTCELAIAAGLEALKNAHIPLGQDGRGHLLPKSMRDETGVIFASSFPQLDSCVEAVTRQVLHRFSKLSDEEFLQKFLPMGNLREKFSEANSNRCPSPLFKFDRKLLFKWLVLANNQLAQLIGARGPNTYINAACASTTQAIGIASDWIKLKRCKRVVVISADNATSENLTPFIATGFLSLGASSVAKTVSDGALSFDRKRNGMILGMGATALVLETSNVCQSRGTSPLASVIHTQFTNSAFHACFLDKQHIGEEMERFIKDCLEKLAMTKEKLSRSLIYYSHETGTAKDGGCAMAEISALRQTFGDSVKNILICALKGFVGHPMGVNIEDSMAIASLSNGRVPPIANFVECDEKLGEDLNYSKGGRHSRRFVLRTAAGFGSQIVFALYKKFEGSKTCGLI